jgi:hypothetical protein
MKHRKIKRDKFFILRLSPESYGYLIYRQVFWLVRFLTAFPLLNRTVAGGLLKTNNGLTATGIAPEFPALRDHRIPFSSQQMFI